MPVAPNMYQGRTPAFLCHLLLFPEMLLPVFLETG